jgi:hypothetical protein
MKKITQEKVDWVVDYMKTVCPFLDITNSDFVDRYVDRFGVKESVQWYGANKCKDLSKTLKAGYDAGVFERNVVGIKGRMWGVPAWVFVYQLPKSDSKDIQP